MEITASEPIVPFRETVILPPTTDTLNEAILPERDYCVVSRQKVGLIEIQTPDKQCLLKMRCLPLPAEAAALLEKSTETLKALNRSKKRRAGDSADKVEERLSPEWQMKVDELRKSLEKALFGIPETDEVDPFFHLISIIFV